MFNLFSELKMSFHYKSFVPFFKATIQKKELMFDNLIQYNGMYFHYNSINVN